MKDGLEAKSLSVSLGAESIVSNISFLLLPGEVLRVAGESGSGKSTLLRALARLVPWTQGEVLLDGQLATGFPAHHWRCRVAYLPTPSRALGPTLREDLLAPFSLRVRKHQAVPGEDRLREELSRVDLAQLDLDGSPLDLSEGQKARAALVRTVLAAPEVLLLDEPTANLDERSAGLVIRRVTRFADDGGTVVVASHDEEWESSHGTLHLPARTGRETPR